MPYKSVEQISPDEVEVQIAIRRKLIDDCIGSLYPMILQNEIIKLLERAKEQWYFQENM